MFLVVLSDRQPKPSWADTDHLEASLWRSLLTESHTDQPWETLLNCLKLKGDPNQILKLHALQHIKTNSPKTTNLRMLMTRAITGAATPKYKTKSNLPDLEVKVTWSDWNQSTLHFRRKYIGSVIRNLTFKLVLQNTQQVLCSSNA